MTLEIKGWRGSRLIPGLIQRFLRGEEAVFGDIIEFEGMRFDEAHVEVQLDNGQNRTFNLNNPDGGHAVTQVLTGLRFDADGYPAKASLFKALAEVIDTLPR